MDINSPHRDDTPSTPEDIERERREFTIAQLELPDDATDEQIRAAQKAAEEAYMKSLTNRDDISQ